MGGEHLVLLVELRLPDITADSGELYYLVGWGLLGGANVLPWLPWGSWRLCCLAWRAISRLQRHTRMRMRVAIKEATTSVGAAPGRTTPGICTSLSQLPLRWQLQLVRQA